MAALPVRKLNMKLRICSINIGGMSSRSRFMVDKYNDIEKFDIIAAQESGSTNADNLAVTNMHVIT